MDEYADEISRVVGQNQGLAQAKSSKKILQMSDPQVILGGNRNHEKRSRVVGNSQSALDHHQLQPVGLISKHESLQRINNSPSLSNLNSVNVASLPNTNKKRAGNINEKSHGLLSSNHNGQNYVRVVNIYSVNNSYKKRKSHANESRVQLNHSMLPQAGA